MSLITSEPAEAYCVSKSSRPSDLRNELFDFTVTAHPMFRMLVGPLEGAFLSFLIRATGSSRVLEFGTFTGYSALAMAEALPSDGEVLTLDIDPETNAIAREHWSKSPHGKKIRPILGSALQTMRELKGPFDFVFIDADKPNYQAYFDHALTLLSPRGVIAVDNCLWDGKVWDSAKGDESTEAIKAFNTYLAGRADLQRVLVPIRDGVFLVTKII